MKKFRPPCALKEDKFLEKCTMCNKCVEVCPTNAIKISNDYYPEFVGPCVLCMKCVEVCPSGALKKIKKEKIKIGICKIDINKCNSWDPKVGNCLVCWEWCPVGAVELTAKEVKKNPEKDPRLFVAKPIINQKRCIGCCMCVHACPKHAINLVDKNEDN